MTFEYDENLHKLLFKNNVINKSIQIESIILLTTFLDRITTSNTQKLLEILWYLNIPYSQAEMNLNLCAHPCLSPFLYIEGRTTR